jgi:integrase
VRLEEKMLTRLREKAEATGKDPEKVKLEPWTLHDLRRTAMTLMVRAGVPEEHADRVLGHVPPRIKKTYNRHSYVTEKKAALEKLAETVLGIVGPEPEVKALPAPPLALPAPGGAF